MPNLHDFIIGGAQFGQSYGVVSGDRQLSEETISSLLKQSWNLGISLIDTAPSYGDSERILGKKEFQKFDFITKLSILESPDWGLPNVQDSIEESLHRLQKKSLNGYLIHNAAQFLKKKNSDEIWLKLCDFKAKGIIRNLGFSVYEEFEIIKILNSFPGTDFLQVPINLFDQRLSNSNAISLARLQNVSIHARSIFLQGLLLCDINKIPLSLGIIRDKRRVLEAYNNQNGCTNLEMALAYIRSLNFISKIVVGLKDAQQLKQLNHAFGKSEYMTKIAFENFRIDDINSIDPRRWRST